MNSVIAQAKSAAVASCDMNLSRRTQALYAFRSRKEGDVIFARHKAFALRSSPDLFSVAWLARLRPSRSHLRGWTDYTDSKALKLLLD